MPSAPWARTAAASSGNGGTFVGGDPGVPGMIGGPAVLATGGPGCPGIFALPDSALAGNAPAPILYFKDPDTGRADQQHIHIQAFLHQQAAHGDIFQDAFLGLRQTIMLRPFQ